MAPSASALDDDDDAMTPSSRDSIFDKCIEGFTETCGAQIYEGVFGNKSVTSRCCANLVKVGKPCHDGVVKRILGLELPSFMNNVVEESQILSRSEEVWKLCVSVGMVQDSSPTPSPIP